MKLRDIEYLMLEAEKNADLYEKGGYEFHARMYIDGYNADEIEIMVNHLERKSK